MKSLYLMLLLAVFAIVSCSKKEDAPASAHNQIILPSYSVCQILATFSDTVSQMKAESFLHSHNIKTYTLPNFDLPSPHSAVIQVANGQGLSLVDTLKKYPEIKSAKLQCLQVEG